jgi:non-ribosomal peptide synthetase component F/acyl carrier protein
VAVPHRCLLNLLTALEQRVLAAAPRARLRATLNAALSFDASMQQLLLLLRGHALHLVPEQVRTDGPAFVAFLDRHRIDLLDCTPSQLRVLLAAGLLETGAHVPSLVLVAGEAIDRPMWRALAEAPRTTFFNIYGPTECTVDATGGVIARGSRRPVIGRPLANYRTYVLDRGGEPVPRYVTGELYIGGAGVARGYRGRPALTAERFVPDPFGPDPGGRLYRTGDLARILADGTIEFVGRADHQVKLRGFRIELEEIEAVLAEHEAVAAAAVALHDGPRAPVLVAHVVARDPSRSPTAEVLRPFLARRLPDHMLPSSFMVLPALPMLRSGKVDRAALPAPELGAAAGAAPRRTPTEDVLAGIWADVLQVEAVGADHDFFELGGDSLLTVQLVARARDAFRVELPLRGLFHSRTLAAQAALVDAVRREQVGLTAPPILPVDRAGALPLSFAQQRLWFLDRLSPGSQAYNVGAAIRLEGLLDASVLQRSLEEIVRRHEVLRTTFDLIEGRPVQVIHPAGGWRMAVLDLRARPAAEAEREARRVMHEEATHAFDLGAGPLFRATLIRQREREALLVLAMHHIVSDGWSVAVLAREAAALHEAFGAGRPSPLEELPVQYADFAVWQRGLLAGAGLDRLLAYWREQLRDAPPVLELPADRPRSAARTYRAATEPFVYPDALGAALLRVAREERATLFMVLLAAFEVLLYRYSGQPDLVIGAPIANRSVRALEGLIGFFANTLALRGRLSGNPTFRELLGRVRETTLDAYAHRDLPY